MKTLKTLFIIAIAGTFLFIASCSKDEDSVSKTEIITANSWKYAALTINPPIDFFGIPISDFLAFMDDCEKDNLFIFNTSGSYTIDEGATKCDDADPQTIEVGTWSFNSGETQLSLATPDTTITMNIVGLSSSKVTLATSEVLEGVTYTTTMELVPAN